MSAGILLYLLLTVITLLGLLLNVYILIVVLLSKEQRGLLLNVYILIVVLLSKELATGNKLLLIHLSLVNVLLSLLFLLVVVPHSLHYFSFLHPPGVRNRATSLCDLHGFLFSLLHSVAIWNVCGLNCDRYYAIAAPLHYSVLINQKKVGLCLAVTWFLCVLACIPPFFRVSPYSYDPDFASCVPDFKSGKLGTLWYSSFFIVSTFLLPVTVILICNIKVLMIARYHRHRIASAIFEVTLSAQVTITHQKNPFYNSLTLNKFLTRKSAYNTVFELLASFLLIYLPYYSMIVVYHVVNLSEKESDNVADFVDFNVHNRHQTALKPSAGVLFPDSGALNGVLSVLSLISFALITSSTLVNSLLYGIKSKILRKSFQNYWRKQKSKCEIYNEIQARTPSTCGSRRPSLTPLGILTKPAPLIRRSSEIGMETNNNSSSKSSNSAKKLKSLLSNRQISTSTSKLSLSTQETLSTQVLGAPNANRRMSNSVQNINKSFFHIRSQPTNHHNGPSGGPTGVEVTTSFINSPRILITKTLSQDNSGGCTDDEYVSLEPNRSLESATTYESVRVYEDKSFDLESAKYDAESIREYDSDKAFDTDKFNSRGFDSPSRPSENHDGKVLSFLSLNSDSEDEATVTKTTVSE
ncbi:hypothetical protein M8J77_015743 [Diaphorina citri]|nr:hypothetical protein M8J77_015743 [Diaphorina citri]